MKNYVLIICALISFDLVAQPCTKKVERKKIVQGTIEAFNTESEVLGGKTGLKITGSLIAYKNAVALQIIYDVDLNSLPTFSKILQGAKLKVFFDDFSTIDFYASSEKAIDNDGQLTALYTLNDDLFLLNIEYLTTKTAKMVLIETSKGSIEITNWDRYFLKQAIQCILNKMKE